ncbi:Alpha/Beta hydrolase protein [Plectosphaerella plurivora]|uniref:Alpha/Beta hydrolase protein n=1 Tax=Plectosphaerella plurivora TaxID=936078 RepID=A0A9P9AD09_9PEZI|nr:Alpha/Beta hydrolase protein [Plectosphaerella plurivora]
MAEANPMSASASKQRVSKHQIIMAGLLCDVYGLDEETFNRPTALSCLWLHHPRTKAKEDMQSFATHIVNAWLSRKETLKGAASHRGLVVVAFDQRNHGERLVDERANAAWRSGNPAHAPDMFGAIRGMVSDNAGLMDLVEGYVRMTMEGPNGAGGEWPGVVDQHLVLGVSLGGHSAWQALFSEERVSAAVVVIGCPDFMGLLSNRARLSKRECFSALDNGASFLGSRDFPRDLVRACLRYDPKGILFGTDAVRDPENEEEKQRLRGLLDARIRGKKVLVCSGGDDKLVPYAMSEAFVRFMERAAGTWYADRGVTVVNKVYEEVGHVFSPGMVEDATAFLLEEIASAPVAVPRAGTFGEKGKPRM